MQNINNPWLGFLDRSYQQIKTSCINALKTIAPEITDFTESNPLVIILSMFSGMSEMLNFYIDNQARESFIQTCRLTTSAIKLTRVLDYRVKARSPESVIVNLFAFNADNTPYSFPAPQLVNEGVQITGDDGFIFTSKGSVTIPLNATSFSLGVEEFTVQDDIIIGITTNQINQVFSLGSKYMDGTVSITINSIAWVNVRTFAFSKPTDKHYIVDIDVDGLAKIFFGDGIKGQIPDSGFNVVADYYTTEAYDRKVIPNSLNSLLTNIPGPALWVINNPQASSGGMYYEDIERIRRNSPALIRTRDVAVTFLDYTDIALMVVGVKAVYTKACCAREITIYIAPTDNSAGGGIASGPLLDSVEDYFEDNRTLFGRTVEALPAGVTHIKIGISGKANYGYTTLQANQAVKDQMDSVFGYQNSYINRKIRISDIYGALESLKEIDYTNIDYIRTEPYARPQNSTNPLVWTPLIITSTAKVNWKIQKNVTVNQFSLFKNGSFIGTFLLNTLVNTAMFPAINNILSFTVLAGSYVTGNFWEFVTYVSNGNVELDDFTVPVISSDPSYNDISSNIQIASIVVDSSSCS